MSLVIRGRVDFTLEAVVVVPVMDGNGQFRPVEFVIDTGFDGCLTLPPGVIQELGLELTGSAGVTFGNGQTEDWPAWQCRILWHDRPRDAAVFESRGESLLGMALLEHSAVTIQVRTDGEVVIEELGQGLAG